MILRFPSSYLNILYEIICLRESCLKTFFSYLRKSPNDDNVLDIDKWPVFAEGRVEHQKLNQTAAAAGWLSFWCSTRFTGKDGSACRFARGRGRGRFVTKLLGHVYIFFYLKYTKKVSKYDKKSLHLMFFIHICSLLYCIKKKTYY